MMPENIAINLILGGWAVSVLVIVAHAVYDLRRQRRRAFMIRRLLEAR